ncbi:MAG: carbohydrate-binding domain-containing protein [Clostridia bacterium]|nr:carbohydrate-binding domain-containing protein [Clostridia bacterium]
MKKTCLIVTALCTIFTFFYTAIAEENKNSIVMTIGSKFISLYGTIIENDVAPKIVNERTMLPARVVAENLGSTVLWEAAAPDIVAVVKDSVNITITIGSEYATVNEKQVFLDSPAFIENDRTYMPVRFIVEELKANVLWVAETQTVVITPSSIIENWQDNIGGINLASMSATGSGISVLDNSINIIQGGIFNVSGDCANVSIIVNTNDTVKLNLMGVTMINEERSPILVEGAEKVFLSLQNGCENYITADSLEEGAIFSRDDLEIDGDGVLYLTNKSGHGIKANDDLTIWGGDINIQAGNDGLNINNDLAILGGEIKITCAGDGISADKTFSVTQGRVNISATAATGAVVDEDFSSKGIKAIEKLTIKGGDITIKSTDHCIKCDDAVEIFGGNLILNSTAKKGITGQGAVSISGKDTYINISNATEGIESKTYLTVNDGEIHIQATDDALNAGAGIVPDMTREEYLEFRGNRSANAPVETFISINGGSMFMTAGMDGIDSNGAATITNAFVGVSCLGVGKGAETAFDTLGPLWVNENSEIVFTLTRDDLPEISKNNQGSFYINLPNTYSAKSRIALKLKNETICEYAPEIDFSKIYITTPKLNIGGTYTLYIDGQEIQKMQLSELHTVTGR